MKMDITLLAIDDVSLPMRRNVCLHLTKPDVRPEPVLSPEPVDSDAPDNAATHFYGTVIGDHGRFRMWYYACHWGMNPDWSPYHLQQLAKKPGWVKQDHGLYQGPLCYAESDDGITWKKPALGQLMFKGNTANNALALPHAIVSGATIIRDDDDPDPDRRYKMVYQYFPDQADPVMDELGTMPSMCTAVSPDGLSWSEFHTPYVNEFVEHSSFYQHDGHFIVNYQTGESWSHCSEGGNNCGRTGLAKVSPDFTNWIDGHTVSFGLPEPADPGVRGLRGPGDQVHLGVGAMSLGSVCVGLFGRWHNADSMDTFHEITCDLGLVVSNDGLHFREPVQGHNFINASESPAELVPGKTYNTVLCQANGILNVGDETRIYHGRWRNVGPHPENLPNYRADVGLAVIPRDRWGSLRLNPGTDTGHVFSSLIRLPDGECGVGVNADCATGITVSVHDRNYKPIRAFCGNNSGRIADEGGFDCPVTWSNGDITRLVGDDIHLCFNIERNDDDPALYAACITSGDAT
jgi:hypothetical protein